MNQPAPVYCGPWSPGAPLNEPAIYFGMPFAEYDKIPAIRASHLKRLTESARLFYVHHILGEPLPPQSKASDVGRAIHALVIEGRATFDAEFKHWPDLAETKEDILSRFSEFGLKASMRKPDMIAAILAEKPDHKFLIGDTARHYAAEHGVTLLSADAMQAVNDADDAIRDNPDVRELLDTAWPEITCIWRDEYGTLFADRLDKVGCCGVVELKTRQRQMGQNLAERSLRMMATDYRLQMGLHQRAMQHLYYHAKDAPNGAPFYQQPDLHYIFVHQDANPDAVCWSLYHNTARGFRKAADQALEAAIARYYEMRRLFPDGEPWREHKDVATLWDIDCPGWMVADDEISASEG